MTLRKLVVPAIAAGLAMAGCAADGSLQTASVNTAKPAETKVAAVDPACAALSNQIDLLRKEGSVERLEKAASGKGASVKVKRESLAKQAELNRVYADFQTKCGPRIPVQATQAAPAPAQVAPVAAAAAPATAAAAASKKQ